MKMNSKAMKQIHMIMMIVLLIMNTLILVPLLRAPYPKFAGALYNVINCLALVFGIVYLRKGYSKNGATYYKLFLLLVAASNLALIGTMFTYAGLQGIRLTIAAGAIIIKIILILALAFAKDLGRRNSRIIFCVLLTVELIYGFLFAPRGFLPVSIIVLVLSRLIMTGVIGLAIKGKYEDKASRGAS